MFAGGNPEFGLRAKATFVPAPALSVPIVNEVVTALFEIGSQISLQTTFTL